ncbi:MAG TPA: ATP-binding domain-containing protein [Kofleriaceae bacterium]|nr:ATP-binding domain-containing protein [Kofleriaceae bacterium]
MLNEIEKGSAAALIVEEEERLLARVEARVAIGDEDGAEAERSERTAAADYDRELLSLRDAIAEAKPEDLPPLVEQMTRLAAIRERIGGARALPVDMASPYFAHMVLRDGEAGAERRRDVLVGKRGFIDRRSNVQIVDWRNAPISQVYYRYDEGDDYEETVDGRTLAGVVEVRRNVSINRARLRRIGAPQGTYVRDARGVWREAVGSAVPTLQGGSGKAARAPMPPPRGLARRGKRGRRGAGAGAASGAAAAPEPSGLLGVHHGTAQRADKHLPEIAALIDREQFDLITSPSSGIIVLQGGAGSGKTTVALHRIAYLNFADKGRFRTSQMLFVVPSEALVRYVSAVLPALGVSGVPVTTYRSWARTTRQKLLPDSPTRYAGGAHDAVVRLKKHPRVLLLCDELAAERVDATTAALERELTGADPVEGGAAVLDRWRQLAGAALVPRLRRLHRWLGDASGGAAALPAASRVRAESLVKSLTARADDIMSDWGELFTDRARLTRVLVDAGEATSHEVRVLVDWCAAQLSEPAEPPVDSEGRPIESVDGRAVDEESPAGRLDEEDDPVLLRLVQLARGALVARGGDPIEYRHVAIDEAQDRSAIEVKVLIEATHAEGGDPAARSVTIAGDTAQRLVFDNHFTSWRELLEEVGQPVALMRPLRLSYRSTAEVMQLARYILGPDLAPEEPLYARSGAPVEVHELGGVGEAVAFLAEALRGLSAREPTASVAVIARYAEQADIYHDGLARAEVPSLRRVKRQDFRFEPGVDVTDIGQVKGLEFDYVVMVDVNASVYNDTLESRHLLHIGATRAAHQLWLLATQEPSPLIPPGE